MPTNESLSLDYTGTTSSGGRVFQGEFLKAVGSETFTVRLTAVTGGSPPDANPLVIGEVYGSGLEEFDPTGSAAASVAGAGGPQMQRQLHDPSLSHDTQAEILEDGVRIFVFSPTGTPASDTFLNARVWLPPQFAADGLGDAYWVNGELCLRTSAVQWDKDGTSSQVGIHAYDYGQTGNPADYYWIAYLSFGAYSRMNGPVGTYSKLAGPPGSPATIDVAAA